MVGRVAERDRCFDCECSRFRQVIPDGPPYDMGDFVIMPRECACGQVHHELLAKVKSDWALSQHEWTIKIGEADG